MRFRSDSIIARTTMLTATSATPNSGDSTNSVVSSPERELHEAGDAGGDVGDRGGKKRNALKYIPLSLLLLSL
jgi:hypothetical protein